MRLIKLQITFRTGAIYMPFGFFPVQEQLYKRVYTVCPCHQVKKKKLNSIQ